MRLLVATVCCLASCFAAVWPTTKAPKAAGPLGQAKELKPEKFSKGWPDAKVSSSQGKSIFDNPSEYSVPLGSTKNKGKENSADIAATKSGNSSTEYNFSKIFETLNLENLNFSLPHPPAGGFGLMQGGLSNKRSPSRDFEESPDEPTRDRSSSYQSRPDQRGSSANNRVQYKSPAVSLEGPGFFGGSQSRGTAREQTKVGSAPFWVQPQSPGSGKAANNPVGVVTIGTPASTKKKAATFTPTTPPLKKSNQVKKPITKITG